jgi:hypothetical protein
MFKFAICSVVCLTTLLSLYIHAAVAEPVNHAAVLAPYLNEDTFAVGWIDIGAMKDSGNENQAQLLNVLPMLTEDGQAAVIVGMMIEGFVQGFQKAGGQSLYVIAGLADLHVNGGPLVLATSRAGLEHPDELEKLFRDLIEENLTHNANPEARQLAERIAIERKGNAVLIGMKSTVARYRSRKSENRAELVEPLTQSSKAGAVATVVFCPGTDFRRVVSELWPELPGSLTQLRGELAANWRSLALAINLPPDPKPRLALQASDHQSAQLFAKLWQNLLQETTEFGGNSAAMEQVKEYAQSFIELLPAKVEGTRVEIEMRTGKTDLEKLQALFRNAYNKSAESRRRRERTANLHNISLGLLNYESSHGHLPPAAIYDKEGQALLSWRVMILPYLDEGELYKKFHLDEPWDSPNNRALIAKMPRIYADPDPKLAPLVLEGKTTYQVPVGPEMIFYNKEGAKWREIKDGTVSTVLIVEVDPSRAVSWTKPEDWEVDLSHPRRGLERAGRNVFTAAFGDGSVQVIDLQKVDDATLRALLTRAGGETVKRP